MQLLQSLQFDCYGLVLQSLRFLLLLVFIAKLLDFLFLASYIALHFSQAETSDNELDAW